MKKPMKFKTPTVGKTLTPSAFITPIESQNSAQKQGGTSQSSKRKLLDGSISTPLNKCNLEKDTFNLDSATLERKKASARALMMGNVQVERKPFMTNGILSCGVHKKFQPPGNPSSYSKSLTKKLGGCSFSGKSLLRPKFSSGASFSRPGFAPKLKLTSSVNSVVSSDGDLSSDSESDEDTPEFLPHEPLIVWEPTAEGAARGEKPIQVPTVLAQFLRPHQRAGVEFCSECLLGMKEFDGHGCILADDMGLGKTLQSIATMYTLMKGSKLGPEGPPIVKRAIVVCPCSLVNNWAQEFDKWINSRVKTEGEKVKACAIAATDKKSVNFSIAQFLHVSRPYDVLVISYETFRLYVGKFTKKNDICCDLLICDEAHRLKNPEALTTKALASLACRRRVLLSGTPVQNDLDEFFAMADFTNPTVLGSNEEFRRRYKNPILIGREPEASQMEQDRAKVLQNEMSNIVNQFILRRTNTINAKFLPDKLVQVVCCKLTETQKNIYRHLIASKDVTAAINGKVKDALSYIQNMQKLCNHPKILECSGGKTKGITMEELSLFGVRLDRPDDDMEAKLNIHAELSGKMMVLHNLMDVMWRDQTPKRLPDRIVVISIYTQTLDLVERMCKGKKWPVVRLDGSLAIKKRMEMVNAFNDMTNRNAFCFLLSSKAGGCGINLIGANRLVLFDSDWNPATDKQAAARCWRDGQKKHCYTYRFLSAGTLEEKIFQRQLSKEGLASVVEDKDQVNSLGSDDLKQLFKYRENTPSDTHDKLKCKHCRLALEAEEENAFLGDAQVTFLNDLIEWMKILPESQYVRGGTVELAQIPEASPVTTEEVPTTKAKAKSKMSNLTAIQEKLKNGEFKKMTEFHKDIRNLLAAARKNFAAGTAPYSESESLREQFEERWLQLAPEIQLLQATGTRTFTAEEIASATADIQSHAVSSAPARQGRSFNKPGKPKSNVLALSAATNSLSSASTSAPKRLSLSQPPFKPQHEMPKEEDLNNWSHHFSVDTIEDDYLRQATQGTDLVSFIFGLNVNWELTQKQTALDDQREADDKERRDMDLEQAKGRLGDRSKKKKKVAVSAEVTEVANQEEEESVGYMASDDGGNDEDNEGEVMEVVDENTAPETSNIEVVAPNKPPSKAPEPQDPPMPEVNACNCCSYHNEKNAKKCQICGHKLAAKAEPKKAKRAPTKAAPKTKKKSKKMQQAELLEQAELAETIEVIDVPAEQPTLISENPLLNNTDDSDFE